MSDAISYQYTDNKPQLRSDKNSKLNGGLKYQLTVKTCEILEHECLELYFTRCTLKRITQL